MKNHYPKKTIIFGVKQFTLLIGLLLGNLYASAQAPDFDWVRQSQANNITSSAGSNKIAHDTQGNSYITGSFQGSVTFGSTTLTSSGSNDIFVAKYNAAGNVLWAKKAGGISGDSPSGIVVDGSGNSYITGTFQGSATFGSITLTESQNSEGDVFVAKYNAAGNVLWAKKAGGKDSDIGRDIAIDGKGNSYITGFFYGSATFGSTTLTSAKGSRNRSSSDVFVAKYDGAGNLLWAKKAGGTGNDAPIGIATDGSGHSYITGTFQGNVTFGNFPLTSSGSQNVFVAKYDAAGNVLWAKIAVSTGTSSATPRGITIDGSGNSFITGRYYGSTTFGNITLAPGSGNAGGFVAKYDANGEVVWVQNAGSGSGISLEVDGSGNSYVAGCFCCSATFGSTTLTSSGSNDIFVAKYDATGNVLWAEKAGGTGDDFASGIAIDGSGNSYITGYFPGSATFGSTTLTSNGTKDAFIAKINAAVTPAKHMLPTAGTGNNEKVLHVHDVNAYPNPFLDKLMMELTSETAAETAKVTLNAIDGKMVYQKEVKLNKGRVSEELNGLSRLPAGMYFLMLQLDDKPIVLKVMKQ